MHTSTRLQICLYRPPVAQVATLTQNDCCNFSQAEAVEVPVPVLCSHLYRCSCPPWLEDVSLDFFVFSPVSPCLGRLAASALLFHSWSQRPHFLVSSSTSLFLAVSGAAFTEVGSVHLGGAFLMGHPSSFSDANLTLQTRLCSLRINWNLLCPICHPGHFCSSSRSPRMYTSDSF